MNRALVICGAVIATMIAGEASVNAQTTGAQAAPVAEGTANKTPPFKKEELESILAPIALYPDALLAQIFMASTYPLEIVEAARWSKAHPDVKGDAVAGAVQKETWDPSVKSLCAFPTVLEKMNEKIDWTQKLGDAFLAQQKEVMQAVQILRDKAKVPKVGYKQSFFAINREYPRRILRERIAKYRAYDWNSMPWSVG